MSVVASGGLAQEDARRLYQVTTPEGLVLPFRLATLGDRAGAFLIDLLVVLGGMIVLWIGAALAVLGGVAGAGMALAIFGGFVLRSFYFAVCEVNWGGKTFGKRMLGLRVIARDGGPLTAEAVLARNLMREAEIFLPATLLVAAPFLAAETRIPGWALLAASAWLFVFALLPVFSRERLRCGDLVAGTLVVQAPRAVLLPDLAVAKAVPAAVPGRLAAAATLGGPAPAGTAVDIVAAGAEKMPGLAPGSGRGPEFFFSREQLDIYGIRELQVLEGLLRRHAEGTLSEAMLAEVAERIQRKIGWAREPNGEPGGGGAAPVPAPPFLQAFYRAQRARLEQKLLFGQRQERKREP